MREVASEMESDLDLEGLALVKKIYTKAEANWPLGALSIVAKRNKMLHDKFKSVESRLNSLLLIRNKPVELEEEFKRARKDFEQVINLCAEYANRHIEN